MTIHGWMGQPMPGIPTWDEIWNNLLRAPEQQLAPHPEYMPMPQTQYTPMPQPTEYQSQPSSWQWAITPEQWHEITHPQRWYPGMEGERGTREQAIMAGINKALAGQSAIELWNQILQPPQQPPTEDYISSLQRRKAAGEWLSDAEYADLMGATQQPQPTITPPEEIAPSRAPQPLPETREPWEYIGTGRAKEYQAEYDEVKAKAAQYGEGSLSDEERSTLHHGDKISKQPGGYAKYAYDQIMAERERA